MQDVFQTQKITSVLGSGEVFFQEPYQCISCCFKPVQVVQQRPESSSKNNENKVDAKMKPSKNTSTETRNMSSFLTKKYKLTLAVVNEEIALVEMKTAQVEVKVQIQIRTSRYEIAKVKVEVQHMLNNSWIVPIIQFLLDYLCFELGFLFDQF